MMIEAARLNLGKDAAESDMPPCKVLGIYTDEQS